MRMCPRSHSSSKHALLVLNVSQDDITLKRGTKFLLLAPLIQDDGTPLDSTSANKLLAGQWLVNDQFTPGLGGELHLDLYIGEEDRFNFTTQSPLYTTLMNTKIALR